MQRYGMTIPLSGPLHSQKEQFEELVDLGYTDVWSAEADGHDVARLDAPRILVVARRDAEGFLEAALQVKRARADRARQLLEGDPLAARILAKVRDDFRRSGVDKDDDTRARITAINERITELDQDFSRQTRDDVRAIRVTPEQLAGMPEDWLAAHPADDEGLVTVTTDYPDSVPVRMFLSNQTSKPCFRRAARIYLSWEVIW